MASRLAEIYRSEKQAGGGLGSAIGKSLKEKIDPRKMFDQKGLLVSMFPSLKSFNATRGKGVAEKVSSNVGGGIDNSVLNTLAATSSLTAKNTMTLPMMARDMNLIKLNIFKLVKSFGDKPNTNKTDMFYEKSKIRDAAYNNTIGKMMGKGKLGTLAKDVFVGKKERDGQTPKTALYINSVAGGANDEDGSSIVGDVLSFVVLKRILAATLGFLTGPVGLTILGGFGLFKVMENLMDKNADKEGVDLTTKALGGSLDESQIGSEIMKAAEEGQAQREAEDLKRKTVSGPLQRQMPAFDSNGSDTYDSPLTTEGYGVDEKGKTPTPTNAVTSSSGSPIGTGTPGVYVTSGEASTTPSPMSSTATSGGTSPKPIPSGASGGSTSSYIQKASEMIVKEEGLPKGGKAYFDPPGQKKLVSIGYGHQIKDSEYNSGFIQAGNESIPISGERGIDTVLSKTQSQKLLEMDLPKYEKAAAAPLGEAWSKLNDEQKASLISYAYNTGGTASLVKQGLKDAIMAGDFSKAGNIISQKGIRTAGGVENATLVKRRQHEGDLFASSGSPSATPPSPSSGTVVASTSTSVADGKIAAMKGSGGNTVVNAPVTNTLASNSGGGNNVSPYNSDMMKYLLGTIA
jgi:GH24 family phage-related lysozyme (muramidase)